MFCPLGEPPARTYTPDQFPSRQCPRRRQSKRLKYLWEYGFYTPAARARLRFSSLHLHRASGTDKQYREEW